MTVPVVLVWPDGVDAPQPAQGARTISAVRWPSELGDCAYDGIVGDITMAIAPFTEADPAAILLQGLTAFGNVVGRRPRFMADGAAHRMNLYTVVVGLTSKGRKGSSWGRIRSVFEAADPTFHERYLTGLSSGEGLAYAVRDPVMKGAVVDDDGVTDKRRLVVEPEFAMPLQVMKREGNTLSGIIRELWDHGNVATLTKNAPTRTTGAHVSIIGQVTKDELRRLMDSMQAGNGFANRILWLCVRRSQLLPEGGEVPQERLVPLIAELQDAIDRARNTDEMCRDKEARELWASEYERLSEGEPGMLGAVTARAEAQVLRLACLYALTDRSFRSYVVSASHLRSALELWRYCYESARYIFGDSTGDPTADTILSALREDDEQSMTRTEIRDLFGRNRSGVELTRALSLLEEHSKVVRCSDRSGPGRPVERWTLL